jgi:hypothetical protein
VGADHPDTIKKYHSTKTVTGEDEWKHTNIQLLPLNPDFRPIDITAENAEKIRVIAEFAVVL